MLHAPMGNNRPMWLLTKAGASANTNVLIGSMSDALRHPAGMTSLSQHYLDIPCPASRMTGGQANAPSIISILCHGFTMAVLPVVIIAHGGGRTRMAGPNLAGPECHKSPAPGPSPWMRQHPAA